MVFSMPQKKVVIPRLTFAATEIESVERFMRIITCSKYNAHSEPLFK